MIVIIFIVIVRVYVYHKSIWLLAICVHLITIHDDISLVGWGLLFALSTV